MDETLASTGKRKRGRMTKEEKRAQLAATDGVKPFGVLPAKDAEPKTKGSAKKVRTLKPVMDIDFIEWPDDYRIYAGYYMSFVMVITTTIIDRHLLK